MVHSATGKHYIVWQEIFDNRLDIDKHTIVDVWKGASWESELANVTAKGFQAIVRFACVLFGPARCPLT